MGSNEHYPEEAPVHRVSVDGFWIDRNHRTVLAVPLLHADGTQSSFERYVVHHRGLGRLSRLQRCHSIRQWLEPLARVW
jgi:hypothetical protein